MPTTNDTDRRRTLSAWLAAVAERGGEGALGLFVELTQRPGRRTPK